MFKKGLFLSLTLVSLVGCIDADMQQETMEQRGALLQGYLREKILSYGVSGMEDGVVYYAEKNHDGRNEVIRGSYRIENYVPLKPSKLDRDELLLNNSKRAIEQKVSKRLLSAFNNKSIDGSEKVRVFVLFVEDVDLPQLPFFDESQSKASLKNQLVSESIDAFMKDLASLRRIELTEKIKSYTGEDVDYKILKVYTLVNAIEVEVSLDTVKKMVIDPQIQSARFIDEKDTPVAPNGEVIENDRIGRNLANNIIDGRRLMLSDPYASYLSGWIAVIDTGVTRTHQLLNGRISWHRDCVNGTSNNCSVGSGLNPNDTESHGSASASIVGGSNVLGDTSRGVTQILMDSFKVYRREQGASESFANLAAVHRAFPAAIAGGNRVILAELQYSSEHTGGGASGEVAMLANNAYDLGYATIAVSGNYGPSSGTVSAPGNAHKAMAVGAYDVLSPHALKRYSSRGPTEDGRKKPEFIAPTDTRAAYIPDGNSALEVYTGTSGAAPYAAGAAGLARAFLHSIRPNPDPGSIYAFLINSSTARETAEFDNNSGAGKVRLSGPGFEWWGKVTVNQSTVFVPLNITQTYRDLAVTIWWPESPNQTHKQFRIGMTTNACGTSWQGYWPYYQRDSNWQKHVYTRVCLGAWSLQIIPANTVNRNQIVYYSISTWRDGF